MALSEGLRYKIRSENPWWETGMVPHAHFKKKPRAHLDAFHKILKSLAPAQPALLAGPGRVGKTVLLHQGIQRILDEGVEPRSICYIGLCSPAYAGLRPDDLAGLYMQEAGLSSLKGCTLVIDDVHYMPQWEAALLEFSSAYPDTRIVASSALTAADGEGFAALRLPPLLFFEYIELSGKDSLVRKPPPEGGIFDARDMAALNDEFVSYINSGGFPEALALDCSMQPAVRALLRSDLPSIAGIDDSAELGKLFALIALECGEEMTLEGLSEATGAAKNTVKKYLDFLESAGLVRRLQRVDQNGRPFERASANDFITMTGLVKTTVFSQIMHSGAFQRDFYYGRWAKGASVAGIDMLYMRGGKAVSCTAIRWSDEYDEQDIAPAVGFMERNDVKSPLVLTTLARKGVKDGINLYPASLYCLQLGWNITQHQGR
jgi:predicted AAA+ superfamily ATPase